ncbi:hypothetical protein V1478_010807 [Vespula squamosa]|uniref:Uncharacterized protein n=1 Tax=Vespula squamosa TaxID=30214 RepID=A0ABD2AI51_VESSQ
MSKTIADSEHKYTSLKVIRQGYRHKTESLKLIFSNSYATIYYIMFEDRKKIPREVDENLNHVILNQTKSIIEYITMHKKYQISKIASYKFFDFLILHILSYNILSIQFYLSSDKYYKHIMSNISGIVIGIGGGSSRSSSINQKDLKIAARRLYSLGRYRKQNLKVRPLEAPVHGGSCRAGRPAVAVNLDIFYLENQGIPCSKVFAGRRRRRRRRRRGRRRQRRRRLQTHTHDGTSETSDIGSPFIGFSQKECEAQVRRPCAWGLLKTTPQG